MDEVGFPLPKAGITVRGRRSRDGSGLPVLCLHGILDNCAGFEPLAEHLTGVDLIAIDLPGHGLSDPVPSVLCGYLDYAACVLELAHTQGWDRFRLIGHSLGGAVSSLVAGIHPDKVDRLVLIDAIGPLSVDSTRTVSGVARYLDTYLRGDRHPVYRSRMHAVRTRVQLADILLETAELLVERDLVAVADGFSWRHDVRLNRGITPTLAEEQVLAFLSGITAPTLLVAAERTALVEPYYPARIGTVPKLRQVTLPGGHHLHMENAEAVAQEVAAFLVAG
ncbi:alpha/beta hydrolase [Nocardia zapadnayensis]|uniref:alpha/beta fold hydrolase n=1 Tax=Nocardia rhamnosiphila TaxID=426716 RepID=UPI002247C633|nr:alpha/beta hydrolase [Nocardia zapadnayensis]MCX0272544.1 alpha/beta hydrolase [Nocardia zapadnayensis]